MKPLVEGIQLIERNWLSSNQIVLSDQDSACLIDTGYHSHAEQTLALVQHSLAGRQLQQLLNTHLHSDHCGGNALLQQHYGCSTSIPAGFAQAVQDWDEECLSFAATGQRCPRFGFEHTLTAGQTLNLAGREWHVLAAPGHDHRALMFFNPEHGVLISGDALWQNGFGVIFPELDGASGFAEQASLLEQIAALPVRWVLPGHGAAFCEVTDALGRAQNRLAYFQANPERHTRYAVKALLMFIILEQRRITTKDLLQRLQGTSVISACARQLNCDNATLLLEMAQELVHAGQLQRGAAADFYL